ncbi:carboxymethylenebutenolidase [Jatrophihabitans sp. GAS493]|uniref:dienelactone hydrolase family protein n=1 Tax=Jatrophihabitans sp. GAS493 TaxID=1907575 RepID=UPI000BB840A6|nr:dienelactone hydrolase family protein [Jatrophihabitans sp. GAS493]SOD70538.1 carboxymethylenebutenolidase [Jatrophihabitans sp. GAS493]
MTTISLADVPGAPSGSPSLPAYLATPPGAGPWPGVVAIHEAFGLDDVMRRQADRMAAAGYLTVAPDLFTAGNRALCVARTMAAIRKHESPALADIEAARAWLAGQRDCTGKIGVIGFCMGGAFALVVATRGFDVASDNYGALPKNPARALTGACPIIGSYGSRDALAGQAKKLESALTEAGVEHRVDLYPGAGHSFLNDAPNGPQLLRPMLKVLNIGPHPESSTLAWSRIDEFFARHLKVQAPEDDPLGG